MEVLASLTALVISVASGVFALYSFWWTARRDRKQATLDAYNRLQGEVFDKLICTDHLKSSVFVRIERRRNIRKLVGIWRGLSIFALVLTKKFMIEKLFLYWHMAILMGHK